LILILSPLHAYADCLLFAQGPLVSERIPTTAIIEEYAAADPTYRVKTSVSLCFASQLILSSLTRLLCRTFLSNTPITGHVAATAIAAGEVSQETPRRTTYHTWAGVRCSQCIGADLRLAVAFCYYETLLYTADKAKFHEELARITSLSNLAQACGLDKGIYEDFEETALDLLKDLANSTSPDKGNAVLMEAFSEVGAWQSIITWFKVIRSPGLL
jgi:hypothetical protein